MAGKPVNTIIQGDAETVMKTWPDGKTDSWVFNRLREMKKYQIIYADPPWEYDNERNHDPKDGGMTYPTLSQDDLKMLPVGNISDKDCALALWATMPKLREAIEVIDAWGFQYITCLFTWVKLNPNGEGIYSGLGHWVNGNAELCLFGKKGHPKRYSKNVKQIQMHPIANHSKKPAVIRDVIIKLFGNLPRIELFARKPNLLFDAESYDGWDVWGNEVESDIYLGQ